GPGFRGLQALRIGKQVAEGIVELPDVCSQDGYCLHPSLLDGALHVMLAAALQPDDGMALPVALRRMEGYRFSNGPLRCLARLQRRLADGFEADLHLLDLENRPITLLQGLRCQWMAAPSRFDSANQQLLEVTWERAAMDASPKESWLTLPAVCHEERSP